MRFNKFKKFGSIYKDIACIYAITNRYNKKIYIGQTKNFYRRINQYYYDIENKRLHNINKSLYKEIVDNYKEFDVSIVEIIDLEKDNLLERETFWINMLETINPNKGYNLRRDTLNGMITHISTSEKISNNLKEQWNKGLRKEHSSKLNAYWSKNPSRRREQSKIMSKNLTKYIYKIYDLDMNLIEECSYSRLKELKLTGVITHYCAKKVNIHKCKGFIIERVKIN